MYLAVIDFTDSWMAGEITEASTEVRSPTFWTIFGAELPSM